MVIAEEAEDPVPLQRPVATHDEPAFPWLSLFLWERQCVSEGGPRGLRGGKGSHPVLSVGTRVPFSSVLARWGSPTDRQQPLLDYALLQNKLLWNIQDRGRASGGGRAGGAGSSPRARTPRWPWHRWGPPKEGACFLICSPGNDHGVGSSTFPLLPG